MADTFKVLERQDQPTNSFNEASLGKD